MSEEAAAKRGSWVELYFDLIFVFAVGQLSHIMVTEPRWAGLGIALGLFLPLWWTWLLRLRPRRARKRLPSEGG